ncbi:MAG: hypothetical protein P8X57_10775, partial [Cyclobacteriaceae bacterium]
MSTIRSVISRDNVAIRLRSIFSLKYAAFLSLLVLFSGCSEEDEPEVFTSFQLEAISYFKEIALGFEFGTASEITRKWRIPMQIYVGGNPSPDNLSEL